MAQQNQKLADAPAPPTGNTSSAIFDLNNAFAYYVTQLDSRTRGKSISNLLGALETDRVTISSTPEVTYDPPIDVTGLSGAVTTLATSSFENNTSVQDSAQFSESETATASFSTAVTKGIRAGAAAKVTAKIPLIASAELSVSAEASLSSTQNSSSTQSQTFTINTTINVPPESRIAASLVISSVQYSGTLQAKVLVAGRLGVNAGNDSFNVQVSDVFRAILAQPPSTTFTTPDGRGSSFSFSPADLARFEMSPTGGVLYTTSATIDAEFGTNQRVQIQQFDLASGQMVGESTL